MYLIIYSRLNSFVLAFQCRLSAEGQIDMIHAPDPFILDVPRPSDNPAVWQVPRSDPHFSTLAFQEVGPSLKAAAKRHYYPNIRLLKLFLLDSSLALRESIYVGPLAKSNDEEQLSGRDVLRLKTRNPTRQKRELARHESDFVVDDWDESVFGMDTLMAHSVCPTGALPTIPDWVVDHTQTYAVATGEMGTITSGGGDNEHERSFRESIEDLNEKFSVAALSDRHTSSTMYDSRTSLARIYLLTGSRFELLGKTPSLGDIDQNAQDLQQLLDPQDSVLENGYQLLVLPSNLSSSSSTSSARSVELSSTLDLVSTYDRLVNDWLSVLPHTIPGRTRIMKEKVIRGVAVDLNLARVNVTASSSEDSSGPRHGMLTEDSDQADADFSEVGTPGGLEGGGSDSHQYANAMAQNYSSLSSLTTFNGQKPMARSIATMLAHWQPGTTPAAYGWQQTVQDQESESETATRRRPRRSRSRMKLSQSQTPGIGSSTPSAMSSGLPPAQNWGSQPDGANLVKFESSQTVEDDLPMTQVERGTFGGREAARSRAIKARKKRAAGF